MRKLYFIILIAGCLLSLNTVSAQDCSVSISTRPGTTQLNCTYASITLYANNSIPGEPTYTWFDSSGNTKIQVGASQSIVVSNSGIYIVVVTGTIGESACVAKDTITITRDITVPVISVSASRNPICSGDSSTLTATGAYSYKWQTITPNDTAIVLVRPTATTTYTVTGTGVNGCQGTGTLTLGVNKLPDATISVAPTACQFAKEPPVLFTGLQGTPPFIFGYTINDGSTKTVQTSGKSVSDSVNASTNITGTFVYHLTYVTDGNNCTSEKDSKSAVQIFPVPSLTSQKSTTTCSGVEFRYTAISSAGAGTSFSWTRQNTSGYITATGADSGNTATITETLTNTDALPHIVKYFYTLTAGGACSSKDSVVVTVNPGASLTSPASPSLCSGSVFNYTAVSSAGTSTSFSWTRLDTSGYITAIGAASGNTATITNTLTNSDVRPHTIQYSYKLSGGCGANDVVTVTVNPTPVVTYPLKNDTITYCNGQSVSEGIQFKSSSPDSSFTWVSDVNFGYKTQYDTGSIPAFKAANPGTTPLTATVTVSATASRDRCSGPANTFRIIVRPSPALISTKDTSFCNGDSLNYTAQSSLSGTSFIWSRSISSGISASGSSSGTDSFIHNGFVNKGTQPGTVKYFFTLSPDNKDSACDTKDTVTVVVNPTPVITNPLSGTTFTYCNGDLVSKGIPFTSSSPDSSFTWFSDINVGFNTKDSGSIPPFTASNTGTGPVTAKVTLNVTAGSNHCPGAASTTFTVIVKPTANLISKKDTSLCSGSTLNYTAISSLSGTTNFTWRRKITDSAITPTPKEDSTGTTAIIQNTLSNSDQKPHKILYIYTLSAPGYPCEKYDTVTVTVNPIPVVTSPASGTVFTYCNGDFVSKGIPFTSSSPDSSFTWTASGDSIGISGSGSDSIRPFVAKNTTPLPVTSTIEIRVKASSDSCPGQPTKFTIVVLPTPSLISSKTPSLCSDSNFRYKAISSAADTRFSWKRQYDPTYITATGDDVGSSDNIGQILTNKDHTQSHTVKYIFTLTTGNGCETKDSIEVTVNPTPVITNPLSGTTFTYCNRDVVSEIPFISSAPNSSFSWVSDTTVGFGTAGNSSSIPAFIATNTGATPLVAHIALGVIASSDNCPAADYSRFTITVNPLPDLISTKDTSLCSGTELKYEARSSAKEINTTFSWTRQYDENYIEATGDNRGSSAEIDQKLTNHDHTKAHTVKYTFTLTTGSNCSQTEVVTVTVNPIPFVTSPASDTVFTFCNRDSIKGIPFISSAPDSSFTWVSDRTVGFGTEGSNGGIPPFIATNTGLAPVQAHVAVLVRASSDNCRAADSSRFTITVNPSPLVPGFTSLSGTSNIDPLSVCRMSENINFNVNSPQLPAGSFNYEWTFSPAGLDVDIKDKNSPNTAISFKDFNKDTTVTIRLESKDKTLTCTSAASQTVKIRSQVSDIPQLKILKKQPGNILIYPDNSLSGYQWGYDTIISLIPGIDTITSKPVFAQNQVYQFYTPVDSACHCIKDNDSLDEDHFYYWVLLHRDGADGGCDSKIYLNGPYDDKPENVVPINQDNNVRLQIMPNPNNGTFEISLQGNMYGTVEASIYNSAGQVVFRKRFAKTTSAVSEPFLTGRLPGGVYFLLLRSSDLKQAGSRFIISH